MTGFASGRGEFEQWNWAWELRSVNGKGLDLRLRVPDWIEGLEPALRARLGRAMARGSVSLSLRLARREAAGALVLNPPQLAAALDALAEVEAQAMDRGLTLAPANAADVLALRGVMDAPGTEAAEDTAPLRDAILRDLDPLIAAFLDMRAREGRALDTLLRAQLAEIAALTDAAADAAASRTQSRADTLRANVGRLLEAAGADAPDPDRLAQELALIAVKSDVTEEIDRLRAHVGAARDLLDQGGPVGRKLDFLCQEFNRETNTLCSKAQASELTALGLEMKALIDQMREQVQNVE